MKLEPSRYIAPGIEKECKTLISPQSRHWKSKSSNYFNSQVLLIWVETAVHQTTVWPRNWGWIFHTWVKASSFPFLSHRSKGPIKHICAQSFWVVRCSIVKLSQECNTMLFPILRYFLRGSEMVKNIRIFYSTVNHTIKLLRCHHWKH